MKRKEKKARAIKKAIRLTWASLKSHLTWMYGKEVKQNGSNSFHQKCVREYSRLIRLLTKLY